MKKENTKATIKWVYKIFSKFLPQTLIMCLCSAAVSLSFVWLAFLSKNVLELATGERQGNFGQFALLFGAIILAQVIISGMNSLLRTSISGKFTIALREYLFSVINQKKYSSTEQYHSGDILNRFTSDTEVVVSNTVSILPDFFGVLAKIIGGTVALISLEPKIALVVLILGIFVPAVGRIFNKRYKHLHKECQKTEGVTRSFLQECFENKIVIKTFKSEIPFIQRLRQYMSENYRFKIKRAYLYVISHLSLYSFFTIGYYAILVWGAMQISNGSISFGMLIAFLQLVAQLRLPLQNISGIFPKYYSIIASAERLIELEELENEEVSTSKPSIAFDYICGENINFSYSKKAVLKDFNFKIKNGSITAVTGASGSGKSTLFKLILGLYELQSGTIKINGENNADASTRHLFAYVPQGNMILSGSIKDNITMCNPNIPEEDMISACKTAEIHNYISSLPDGYNTVLSERGGGLSEGQIQRLSIARALLANTPVLLLDEATSALDKDTELRVLKNIKALKNKTVILVTHRKTSIDFCDNIINI
ncbi:MAG: ABC transporter ATP-binding protein [Clostridia bacterium]|nr:ABC transporter ATP-binding protein [Clostridia bacterium]